MDTSRTAQESRSRGKPFSVITQPIRTSAPSSRRPSRTSTWRPPSNAWKRRPHLECPSFGGQRAFRRLTALPDHPRWSSRTARREKGTRGCGAGGDGCKRSGCSRRAPFAAPAEGEARRWMGPCSASNSRRRRCPSSRRVRPSTGDACGVRRLTERERVEPAALVGVPIQPRLGLAAHDRHLPSTATHSWRPSR